MVIDKTEFASLKPRQSRPETPSQGPGGIFNRNLRAGTMFPPAARFAEKTCGTGTGSGRSADVKTAAAPLLLLLVAACDTLPRDPDGTSRRIARTESFTVGFVDGAAAADPEAATLIRVLERRTGSKARPVGDHGEALLNRLASGSLDLAIGHFRPDSPWQTEVAFGPVLATAGPADSPLELKAAMRNGENRWIMTVERASRSLSPGGEAR